MAKQRVHINIEEVFVDLTNAWFPPSASVASSFTRLTETLGRIFGELRSDPDLGDLHGEIYRDFPGLSEQEKGPPAIALHPARAAERQRKGFYLCNSLIQLMEDVYLDLNFEQEYRHPDNRGWMNLFRHWSRSDTFRMTWALSASTYGLRFQTFCKRRLSLSLGTTDLVSVWDRTYSPSFKNQSSPLDAKEANEFDNSEKRLIEMLLSPHVRGVQNPIAARVQQVLIAHLLVPSNRTAELQDLGRRALTPEERKNLLSVNYAIVVITGSIEKRQGALLTLRVRRHLRGQGLGRQLIHDLVSRLGVRSWELPEAQEMRQIGLPSGREGIEGLYKSVINEIDLRDVGLQQKEGPASAVFGLVPPLLYSGVVRPPGVTWTHAVGFCYWVLAGADGISEDEVEATKLALSNWAGDIIDRRETDTCAVESKHWYLSAKRPVEALKPEVDTIIEKVLQQPWFDDTCKQRLTEGFVMIADADKHTSEFEAQLIAHIKQQLGLPNTEPDT